MPRKIILDVDTGSDDAVAIMAAMLHPALDLVAVCSVAGNSPIDNTTDNSLRVIDALGGGVPLYRGAAVPLAKFRLGGLSSGSASIFQEDEAIAVRYGMPPWLARLNRVKCTLGRWKQTHLSRAVA